MRFLISIFLVFSFSVNAQNLNQIDNNGQKQGLWKKSYENGNLRYKGQFNNDIPIGISLLNCPLYLRFPFSYDFFQMPCFWPLLSI